MNLYTKKVFKELSHFIHLNNNKTFKVSHIMSIKLSSNMSKESQDSSMLQPPNRVFGMTTLDKSLFLKSITVPYLSISNVKLSKLMPHLKKLLLKIDNFKPIQNIAKDFEIYLNPEKVTSWMDLPIEIHENTGVTEDCFHQKTIEIGYDNFTAETILRCVLPKGQEGMSSFTITGHIVHVNLREHLLPYKNVIGEVLFDKVYGCRTVVNKTDNIDNTYRNFNLEVLKGEDDMITKVKENKCTFEFDFSKVYWNSRLCTEHNRIVDLIKPDSVVFDVFAGVGPFSIPLAKKKCQVFANDLNPESYKWLVHNMSANKVSKSNLSVFNKDGRDFILDEIKNNLLKYTDKDVYILMNLPALAVEFLNAFIGLFPDIKELEREPTVIVYTFSKGEDFEKIAIDLVNQHIGVDISERISNVFPVRKVSSNKEMMRVTFKLDADILSAIVLKQRPIKRKLSSNCQHGQKQTKTEECIQSGGSQESEAESQGQDSENTT